MNDLVSKLGLGTAQWGLAYGVSNKSGQTKAGEVARILTYAKSVGIQVVDTARVYGESEDVLGTNDLSALKIITKLPALGAQGENYAFSERLLDSFFEKSLHALGVERVHGLLIHDCNDLFSKSGNTIVSFLHKLKSLNKATKIGVSAYNSHQIDRVTRLFKPDIIQLPFNVLDQRLLRDGTLSFLKTLGIEVHARSAFLQGLLLMKAQDIPSYFSPWKGKILAWHDLCRGIDLNPKHLALDFVASNGLIDHVIVGVENLSQLIELSYLRPTRYNMDSLSTYAVADEKLLNPSLWKI